MQKVCLLGATGSIGTQTLDIMDAHRDLYQLTSFSAHKNVEKSFNIIQNFKPEVAVMVDEASAIALQSKVEQHKLSTQVLSGREALSLIARQSGVELVVGAIVGAAGLEPILAAAQTGKKILLANKEALVMTGALLLDTVKAHGAEILPVDSEHNALFQCMPAGFVSGAKPSHVDKLILTASGGPFLNRDINTFEQVTLKEAVTHPNWSMGSKISIDSATMMNKALEVIEAHFLFAMPSAQIEVLIHPQSIVHSLVVYKDGTYLAQMGEPDMRIPISACLSWPNRITSRAPFLDLTQKPLHFEKPDYKRFPCLQFAYQALEAGHNAPCILNAANEVAVEGFMASKIKFTQIRDVVSFALDKMPCEKVDSIEMVLEYDKRARAHALDYIHQL